MVFQVDVFGSFKTGLYLPTSDLDLVVFGRWKSKPLHMLRDALVKHGVCTQETTKVIDKATVRMLEICYDNFVSLWRAAARRDLFQR
jgi:non-canonical poly(A) RNA polymerase PAPD5/7